MWIQVLAFLNATLYVIYSWGFYALSVNCSSILVLESTFVTLLHLCVSQIYPSVFALLEPRRKLFYNHLWRGVIHPEPQRVWPTQFLVMMIKSLGLMDVMVMTLMMIMVITVRSYTKEASCARFTWTHVPLCLLALQQINLDQNLDMISVNWSVTCNYSLPPIRKMFSMNILHIQW